MKMISVAMLIVLLVAPVSLAASPFGEDAVPMQRDEMEMVDGEFKHIAVGATAGAIFGTTTYLVTTPPSRWTVSGAARSALAGAISGAGGAALR